MEYGGICTFDGTTGTTNQGGIDALHWEKVTGFQETGPANGVDVNPGNDELQIISDGIYFVFCQIGFSGSTSTRFEFAILKNDIVTLLQTDRNIAGGGAPGSCSIGNPLECKAGDRLAVGCRANAGGKEITLESGQLMVCKLG